MSKAQGQKIGILFTQPLIGDVSGLTPIPIGGYHNVAYRPFEITSLNYYSTSYSVDKAIDGDLNTYWRGTTSINWIISRFSKAFALTTLRLYMSSYYISTFTISGSNDGTSFTQLGGIYQGPTSASTQWYDFPIDNATKYLYYRINTLTTKSSRVQVYELEFLSYEPIGNEQAFTLSGLQYAYEPEGPSSIINYEITSVEEHPSIQNALLLTTKDTDNGFRNVAGDLTIAYNSTLGGLSGVGGPVSSFSETFSPEDLIRKPDIHEPVHIDMLISASSQFILIAYSSYQDDQNSRIQLSSITASGTLISVDDI